MPTSSAFPRRVVSLAPSATEVLFALGCGDRLVARTAFCDFPAEAKAVPAVGGWTTANLQAVMELRPDLVLTSTFLQERLLRALTEAGIKVCHTDPRTLADVLASFEEIGSAVGVPERGAELRRRTEQAFMPHARTPLPRGLRVYAEEWHEPPMASGNWVPDLLRAAGVETLLPPGERSRVVTLKEVGGFDPDVILLNYCGMANVPPGAQTSFVERRAGWKNLRAVRQERILVVDDSLLNRPGPRLAEGLQEIVAALERVPARS